MLPKASVAHTEDLSHSAIALALSEQPFGFLEIDGDARASHGHATLASTEPPNTSPLQVLEALPLDKRRGKTQDHLAVFRIDTLGQCDQPNVDRIERREGSVDR